MSKDKYRPKGKKRADAVAERLYCKDYESLATPDARHRVLAVALAEAESEIEDLKNKISEILDDRRDHLN